MRHALYVSTDNHLIGTIEHDGQDDRWQLQYTAAWQAQPEAYPLSPALPLQTPQGGYPSASIKRFIEHLLPEGRALDVAVSYNGLTRNNVFGLIRALGAETAGALRFGSDFETPDRSTPVNAPALREILQSELSERITQRAQVPLTVWDNKVRMSVAGLQDKLLVYIDPAASANPRLFLADGLGLASTHILKPDMGNPQTPHLAVNEHFCMALARRMGLPAAEVRLMRIPQPVLVVTRFDRVPLQINGLPQVQRLHMIDACQACDLPVSHKYEHNLGNAPEVQNIRDGVSFERLFGCAELSANKATTRLTLLRWALFQFLIGNSDAHGKNFSFFVRPGGLLETAPWYDLVSVLQYGDFDHELAMAYGDVFAHNAISAFALADFATRCGIDRKLLRREGQRLARLAASAAAEQALSDEYQSEESPFVQGIASFVMQQAKRLNQLVTDVADIPGTYL